jgi:hypothetical protein
MTASNRAFANQAATYAEQATCMVTSLDNLTNAALQKNDMVEKLIVASKRLAKALDDANAAMAQLCLPNVSVTPASTASTNNHPRPAH